MHFDLQLSTISDYFTLNKRFDLMKSASNSANELISSAVNQDFATCTKTKYWYQIQIWAYQKAIAFEELGQLPETT